MVIIDGDTIALGSDRVRILNIDAPETRGARMLMSEPHQERGHRVNARRGNRLLGMMDRTVSYAVLLALTFSPARFEIAAGDQWPLETPRAALPGIDTLV